MKTFHFTAHSKSIILAAHFLFQVLTVSCTCVLDHTKNYDRSTINPNHFRYHFRYHFRNKSFL